MTRALKCLQEALPVQFTHNEGKFDIDALLYAALAAAAKDETGVATYLTTIRTRGLDAV